MKNKPEIQDLILKQLKECYLRKSGSSFIKLSAYVSRIFLWRCGKLHISQFEFYKEDVCQQTLLNLMESFEKNTIWKKLNSTVIPAEDKAVIISYFNKVFITSFNRILKTYDLNNEERLLYRSVKLICDELVKKGELYKCGEYFSNNEKIKKIVSDIPFSGYQKIIKGKNAVLDHKKLEALIVDIFKGPLENKGITISDLKKCITELTGFGLTGYQLTIEDYEYEELPAEGFIDKSVSPEDKANAENIAYNIWRKFSKKYPPGKLKVYACSFYDHYSGGMTLKDLMEKYKLTKSTADNYSKILLHLAKSKCDNSDFEIVLEELFRLIEKEYSLQDHGIK